MDSVFPICLLPLIISGFLFLSAFYSSRKKSTFLFKYIVIILSQKCSVLLCTNHARLSIPFSHFMSELFNTLHIFRRSSRYSATLYPHAPQSAQKAPQTFISPKESISKSGLWVMPLFTTSTALSTTSS